MKYSFCVLLSLLITFSLSAQAQTDWKKDQLKGKVKSLTHLENYRYKKEGKFTEWGILYNKKYEFDNTGRYTGYTELTPAGALSYKIKYAYNAKEKKATVSYFDKDEKPTIKKIWSYTNSGQLAQIQEYTKENKPDWRYVYTYNTNGNRVLMESYKPDSTLYSKTSYSFDAKGNETGYLLQTPGYANSGRSYVYDDKGNKTGETWLNGKNETDFRFVYKYDANGNMTEQQKYRQDKLSDTTTWKYEYDSKGNWIKRTQYTSDGVEFDIAERKIEYY